MKPTTAKTLLTIASVGFLAAGVVFLGLSIAAEPKNTAYLSIALGGILLANVLNLLRMRADKRK